MEVPLARRAMRDKNIEIYEVGRNGRHLGLTNLAEEIKLAWEGGPAMLTLFDAAVQEINRLGLA